MGSRAFGGRKSIQESRALSSCVLGDRKKGTADGGLINVGFQFSLPPVRLRHCYQDLHTLGGLYGCGCVRSKPLSKGTSASPQDKDMIACWLQKNNFFAMRGQIPRRNCLQSMP